MERKLGTTQKDYEDWWYSPQGQAYLQQFKQVQAVTEARRKRRVELLKVWAIVLAVMLVIGAVVLVGFMVYAGRSRPNPVGSPPNPGGQSDSASAWCNYYVSPTAAATGDGTFADPWTIDTAFVTSTLAGGDTVCFRGGTYTANVQFLNQTVSGTDAETRLVYRNYPREWPIFKFQTWWPDSTIQYITIQGDFVRFQSMEVYFADWDGPNNAGTPGDSSERWTSTAGSNPSDIAQSGIFRTESGHNVEFVYNICHDIRGACIGANSAKAGDSLSWYGIISYNSGWVSTDGGHGHGYYLSSDTVLAGRDSARTASKSLTFAQMEHGGQLFNTAAYDIGNITIDSNFFWANGIREAPDPATSNGARCILVWGGRIWRNVLYRGNYCFESTATMTNNFSDAFGIGGVMLNATHGDSTDIEFQHNYIVGRRMEMFDPSGGMIFNGNTFVGTQNRVAIDTASSGHLSGGWSDITWDSTNYFRDPLTPAGSGDSLIRIEAPTVRNWTFTSWKDSTGYDAGGTYTESLPTDTSIVVYDAGAYEDPDNARGYILIMNWQEADSITVPADSIDLIIDNGDTYDIRHAHDLTTSVASGTWDGSAIRLQTSNANPDYPNMLGGNPYHDAAYNTAPTFNVFVIRKYWEAGYGTGGS
jgi:hypothetical protein